MRITAHSTSLRVPLGETLGGNNVVAPPLASTQIARFVRPRLERFASPWGKRAKLFRNEVQEAEDFGCF